MERGIVLKFQKNSLTASLIKRISLILVSGVVLFAVFYHFVFPTYYYWRLERPVKQTEQLIKTGRKKFPTAIVVAKVSRAGLTETTATDELTLRLARAGIKLNTFWVSEQTLTAARQQKTSQRLFKQTKQQNEFYARFFIHGDDFYLVGTSIPDFTQTATVLFPLILLATFVFLGLVITLLVVAIRRQLIRPIKELEQTTRQIAQLNFSTTPKPFDNELGALTASITQMQQNLQTHETELLTRNQQLKDFSANLAHELKTPLAVMQLLVDSERLGLENPQLLPELDQQLKRMNELITELLAYSRQLQQDVAREELDVVTFFEQQQEQLLDQDFVIHLQLEPAILNTNRALLQLIVQNLITNALKYSTQPQLVITGRVLETRYEWRFENSAEPIAAETFAQLEKPFVVGETSRNAQLSGHGLGLAIASQAATALGGTLQFEQTAQLFHAILSLPR